MTYFRENIEQLAGYTPGFQPIDGEVVKLNTNENPYPPSCEVMRVLRDFSPEKLRRYPAPLGDSFREAAAKLNGVEPENVMCTNGGDDLLTICFRSFCDQSRGVAFATPTYTLYEVLAKIQGCSVFEVPFLDKFELPIDELAQSGAGLVIVCNPNAPTGSLVSVEKIALLAERLKDKSALLVDEAYVDFAQGSCVSLINEHDNVIILRSMSKGYSLAGLRFGYAISSKAMIEGMIKVKDSYNVDAVAIAAATAAIKDREYFRTNVEKVKAERARVTQELRELGFKVPESNTNFILAQVKESSAEGLFEELKKKLIFVRYFPCEGLEDKLRISIGTAEENDKLLGAIKGILNR